MLKEILASLEGLTDLERAEVLRTLMSGQTVLQKVKVLLGITTEDQDDVLEYVIQTVQTLVLRYINWDELPWNWETSWLSCASATTRPPDWEPPRRRLGPCLP